MSIGINVKHPVAHIHTQNGLAKSFIKRFQLIVRPFLMKLKPPISIWGHAILHVATVVRIKLISYNNFSFLQLAYGQKPNISYLWIFGCAKYVSIALSQRTKMGSQRRLGIYVGYDSPSIIKYLEPMIVNIFTTCLPTIILMNQFS